jgi:hypothetical protein
LAPQKYQQKERQEMKTETVNKHIENMEKFQEDLQSYRDSLEGMKNTRLPIIQANKAISVVHNAINDLDTLGFFKIDDESEEI